MTVVGGFSCVVDESSRGREGEGVHAVEAVGDLAPESL